MKGFGDFRRVSVIIVPDDDTYKERLDKHKENKDIDGYLVTEHAENEMKGKRSGIGPIQN